MNVCDGESTRKEQQVRERTDKRERECVCAVWVNKGAGDREKLCVCTRMCVREDERASGQERERKEKRRERAWMCVSGLVWQESVIEWESACGCTDLRPNEIQRGKGAAVPLKPRSRARYLARVCLEMPSRRHNTLRSLLVLEAAGNLCSCRLGRRRSLNREAVSRRQQLRGEVFSAARCGTKQCPAGRADTVSDRASSLLWRPLPLP